MANNYQFPYSKIIRENGEVIPSSDHNKQEDQLECLTDAVGDYNFLAGSIESRLQSANADINSLDTRVTTLENKPNPKLGELTDVSAPSPGIDDAILFDGSNWTSGPLSLNKLQDANVTGAQIGDSLVLDPSGLWKPIDRQVTVASGIPGSTEEKKVTTVSEIRFISNSSPGQNHEIVEINNGVAYVGAGSPPGNLSTITGLTNIGTGRLSQDTGATYPPSTPAGSLYTSITEDQSFTFTTDASEFGNASIGLLILSINGSDVAIIDLGANFDENNRSTGQNIASYNTQGLGSPISGGTVTYTLGGQLSITSVSPLNSIPIDSYQQGSASFTVPLTAMQVGYNIVTLRHEIGTTVYTATAEWYYDSFNASPSLTPLSFSPQITSPLNHLSGIAYYNSGTIIDFRFDVFNAFDTTYYEFDDIIKTQPLSSGPSWFTPKDILLSDLISNSIVSNPPVVGETININTEPFTVLPEMQLTNPGMTITINQPFHTTSIDYTPTNNIAIMSTQPKSTDVHEAFVDEQYRLPNTTNFDVPISGMPGAPLLFDSTISLIDPSRSGELQVYDHTATTAQNRLQYPKTNYSTNFVPTGQPDYSTLSSAIARTYYRVFRSTSGDKTNGIITFPGITEADLISDISLRIKIPGKTVWLDLTSPFDAGTFPTNAPLTGGVDGEGCRINFSVHNLDLDGKIEFSLGSIGTDLSSDRQLILEITYNNINATEILGSGPGLSINW